MKRLILLILILFIFCFSGCFVTKGNVFYNSIYRRDTTHVKELLDEGVNPNKCTGEAGWVDSNPLKIVAESFEDTVFSGQKADYKDVQLLNLLIDYGADINHLPYIWDRVYTWGNEELDDSVESINKYHKNEIDGRNPTEWFVNDSNRLLKAMLERGMNPNMKGHPVPYTHRLRLIFFTDRIAFMYFNSPEATSPLYEAIKKGIRWERQVDLLLEYGATLDESCLVAAKLSGDEAMIQKIEALLRLQEK